MASRETPQAPAQAYHTMARVLGPGYFLTPPPPHGAMLEVTGLDECPTQWYMSKEKAASVIPDLRADRSIIQATVSKY